MTLPPKDRQALEEEDDYQLMREIFLPHVLPYVKQFGPEGFQEIITGLDERSSLRDMIENGKDKLEWSRKVDQGAVNEIQASFRDNLKDSKMGEVVTKLYKISHNLRRICPEGSSRTP